MVTDNNGGRYPDSRNGHNKIYFCDIHNNFCDSQNDRDRYHHHNSRATTITAETVTVTQITITGAPQQL